MSRREHAPAALWTAAHSAAADRHTMSELGVASPVLMERAALAVAASLEELMGTDPGPEVVVLCGPGNNGGDGFAVARILHGRGHAVRAHAVTPRRNAACQEQLELARRFGVPVQEGMPELPPQAWVVEALLGTGASGALRGPVADAVRALEGRRRVLAIDLPTGVDADTGRVIGAAVRARLTLTMQRSKPGLHVFPGREHAGRVVVADLGIQSASGFVAALHLVDPVEVSAWIGGLPAGRHKGERGHVGLVAGGADTPGAALLAASAALRAGAGLVTARGAGLRDALIAARPELMVASSDEGGILQRATALVVGPGLTGEVDLDLEALWTEDPRPAIWDASALDHLPLDRPSGGPRVITPHPGEAARMLARAETAEAWSGARVQRDRIDAVRRLAQRVAAVVLLKGAGTLVHMAEGPVHVATTGDSALATAGSGDVLSGLIGALLGRGLDARRAAMAGVHVHGLAGTIAARRRPGVIAGDLVETLDVAIAQARDEPFRDVDWPRAYVG